MLFMAQLRTIPDRITNPATPVMSLRETRDILLSEQSQMNAETVKFQQQNIDIQREIKTKTESKPQMEQLQAQRAQAGMTKIVGPGVVIELNDSSANTASEDAIVHAADLRDTINLLWNSGAEAISLNDQRIVFTTAIDCIVNTILINNTRITAPFIIKAVGDRDNMRNALYSQLNLVDIKNRVKYNSLVFNINFQDNLQIPAYQGSFILSTEAKNGS